MVLLSFTIMPYRTILCGFNLGNCFKAVQEGRLGAFYCCFCTPFSVCYLMTLATMFCDRVQGTDGVN